MGTKVLDKFLAYEKELSEKRRWMMETIEKGESEIASFYKDSVVFVTGGSGFLGKQLIEKLIRSCRVAKVYILLRAKKDKLVEERLQTFLKEQVFDSLREEQPDFTDKIVSIEGEISDLEIGISEKDWKTLTEEVNFIFHVAASTNFELPLKTATLINVRGTREVLKLAKDCKQLKSMVYVSTAYCHATKSRIDGDVFEEFYDCPMPVEALIQLAERADQDTLDGIMNVFRKEWPNTYTFTKAVAEEAVRTMAGDVPVSVVRPAVVVGAVNEPAPGWLDLNAAFSVSGIIIGIGLGLVHLFYTDMDKTIDFVPVDYTNNVIIVAARDAERRNAGGDKDTKIYTLSSTRNHSDKQLLHDSSVTNICNLSPPSAVWYIWALMIKQKMVFTLLTWLLHFIPAMFVDVLLKMKGSKIRLMRVYRKAYTISILFDHFVKNDFNLIDRNTFKLHDNLSQVDKEIFHFNLESVDWSDFYINWMCGIRKYIIKDGLKDTLYAQRKQFWLRLLHYIIFPLYLYLLFKSLIFVLCFIFYCVQLLFYSVL